MNPPYPWKKGQNRNVTAQREGRMVPVPDHDVAIIELEICRDLLGPVYSSHKPQGQEDQDMLMSWPGSGQEHLAFALLTEALRREAVLGFLLNLSADKEYLSNIQAMSEEDRRQALTSLGNGVLQSMVKSLQEMTLPAILDAYEDFQSDR